MEFSGNRVLVAGAIVLVMLLCVTGCATRGNAVLAYLDGAELQCDSDMQRENIRTDLRDILTLPAGELAVRRYADYTGKAGQWDLPTLLVRHFVPARTGMTLGDVFYRDVTTDDVRQFVRGLLARPGSRATPGKGTPR